LSPADRGGLRIREVGDLLSVAALDTVDASGLFLHPSRAALHARGAAWLRLAGDADFTLQRSADLASEVVRRIGSTGYLPSAPSR
jgi:hypothetical protein